MTPERWQKIDQILDVVLELDACERTKFLNRTCADDIELRSEVESLLAASEQSGNFIESPFLSAADLGDTDSISLAGQSLGPYRLLREIGQGGMGVVYLAVRADDEFKKQVAIKLVQPGPHNKDLLRRFRRERQILANLDHPNIARLFDGGTTERGVPYLVMEYITGTPITEYCDERKLSITDRLKLYRDVCAAVQHAHQSLVIHRDLKPSNILVTAEGDVKLLDFGIAKLLDTDSTSLGLDTTTGVPVMTPEYASPEQIRGEPVTTASDVYSLGIVLYELLTGHYPYRFKDRSLSEIIRVICEQEPELPSRAISRVETKPEQNGRPQTSVSPETVSRTREGKPEKLRARLRGDLSDIVLMALRKAPHHRYSTVEQLSEDIRRHLEGRIVLARKATLAYRASKFIRRYKTGAAVAMILLLTLLGGIFATLRQANIARQEASKKRRLLYAAEMKLATQAWDTTNTGRLRELVENQVPRDGEEDLRGFEWRYLWRLYSHNGQLFRFQHDIDVLAIDYSPDGKMLVTGDNNGTLTLWDTVTGQQVVRLKAHEQCIRGVKFSFDGKMLATVSDDLAVKVWNTETLQGDATLRMQVNQARSMAFSADGKKLATGGMDGTSKVWDVASGRALVTIHASTDWVSTFVFSPDGKKLALQESLDMPVILWDAETGRKLRKLAIPYNEPVMFLSDSKTLVLTFHGTIKFLNVATGQVKATFSDRPALSVAISPNGRLLAVGGGDRTVKIWDIISGAVTATIKGHEGSILSVAFSPDGKRLATGSNDFTARVWDIATASEFGVAKTGNSVYSLSFSPDGKTLAVIELGIIRTNSDAPPSSYLAPDSKAVFYNDAIINLLDVSSGRQLATFKDPHGFWCALYSPDGKILALSFADGAVKLLDAATYQEINSFETRPEVTVNMVFSPDGHMLATSGNSGTARLWDIVTGQSLLSFTGHTERIS
ncbi:MAG TPA: serine/threonine-protein kinase, partial [Blastocatellia bacterium]|nr:serine/threonine-protein kinase [Blastocatellia bacterium]